jgi:hypothetical protein
MTAKGIQTHLATKVTPWGDTNSVLDLELAMTLFTAPSARTTMPYMLCSGYRMRCPSLVP